MKGRFFISISVCIMTASLCVLLSSCPDGNGGNDGGSATTPTNVTARAQSSTTIYLSWTGIVNADKYTVYRVSDAGSQEFNVYNAYDYTDTGLAPDTLYSYQVSATKGGVEGARSSTVSQKTFPANTTPVPGQVTGVSTSVSGSSVTLTWGAEGGASSYTAERGSSSSGPWTQVYQGSSNTYTDSGVAAGTHYYHVAASNSSGLGPWSTARVAVVTGSAGPGPGSGDDTDTNPPSGIPGYLTVTGTTKNSVSLSWTAVDGATSYKVYRSSTENGTYTETTAGTFNGTAFTNTGLSPNTDYWYKVAAANAGGAGPKSLTPVLATTLANIGSIPGEYTTLALKLAYIGTQFDNGVTYDITVEADESLQATTVMTSGKNVTINLRSPSAWDIKTVSLAVNTGYLFTVSSNITLKLENIRLLGSSANNVMLVRVASGGKLEMHTGSEVTGNTSYGGGIFVDANGTMTMYGGTISGNDSGWGSGSGGGIKIASGATVTMYGGVITGNTAYYGGGVYIANGGHFTKTHPAGSETSGIIYGNDVDAVLANSCKYDGKAVYYSNGGKKRNTTLGGFDEISTENLSIGWE
ncbi:MAG: fibronectin type III domain-containing protein [Treponematales bacterium]